MNEYSEDVILNRLLVESIMSRLDEEGRFILHHWIFEGYSLEEIGPLFGMRFRGRPLTGGDVRYHKNKAVSQIREWLGVNLDETVEICEEDLSTGLNAEETAN